MKLRLNREFAIRHLGVALLMAGLSGWFGYDGYIGYPSHDDAWFETRHLKRASATERQKEFMMLALIAALIIGGHVWALAKFNFEFDDEGFTFGGRRFAYSDIKKVDRSKWEKKDIIWVDGIKLDAWHHTGVVDFEKKLTEKGR